MSIELKKTPTKAMLLAAAAEVRATPQELRRKWPHQFVSHHDGVEAP